LNLHEINALVLYAAPPLPALLAVKVELLTVSE